MLRRLARRLALALPFALALGPGAEADEVVLRGGATLRGVVLEHTREAVRLVLASGAELSFPHADVARVRVEGGTPAGNGKHLRYVTPDPKHAKDPTGGLEVAVTYYVHDGGRPRIDLVGAVHIADRAFFTEVQRVLDAADVVLYEGVKPKGADVGALAKGGTTNPVRGAQQMMAKFFDLVFQLDEIRYDRKHFVHADLDAEAFAALASGKNPKTASGSAAGTASNDAGGALPFGELGDVSKVLERLGPMLEKLMPTGEGAAAGVMRNRLKSTMARTMSTMDLEQAMKQLSPKMQDLLITKRNAVVMKHLEDVVPRTRGNIAVFYGAGHMPDLERSIVKKLGYRRGGARWIRAWNVR